MRRPLLLAPLCALLAGCLQTASLQAPQVLQPGEVSLGSGLSEPGTLLLPSGQLGASVGLGEKTDLGARAAVTPGIYIVGGQLRHQVLLSPTSALVVGAGTDYQRVDLSANLGRLGKVGGVQGRLLRFPVSAVEVWPSDRWSAFFGAKAWLAREDDDDLRFGYHYGGALTLGFGVHVSRYLEWVVTADAGGQIAGGGSALPSLPALEAGSGFIFHLNGPALDVRGAPIVSE